MTGLRSGETRAEVVAPHFPLLEVAGSAYEMGYQHGVQVADLIRRHVLWIERRTGLPRGALCDRARAFLPQIEALSPALVRELRGLAAGARIDLAEALLCQVRTDAAHVPSGGCTAFALTRSATADGQPLAGQNQDLAPEYADLMIVLRVRPDDGRPRAVMVTFAGQLGYAGLNQHGVAHFNNSLFDFRHRLQCPRQPLKRVLLEQPSVAACLALLRRHPVCSAANVVLCDGEGEIADVELRPEGLARYRGPRPDGLVHANHYQTAAFAAHETHSIADSRARLARAEQLLARHWGSVTVETLKDVLADHAGDPAGICRHGATGWHSIAGYIAEPARGVLHVRYGHGCLGTWRAYPV
jgi:isopenicillin-N N-acyltransferase-like protein